MPKRPDTKNGSALLLTILITSLLMIIVLSYTVYVRMELRAVGNRIDLLRAQHHAKLSMHLALNKLQVAAGFDQRVTARAEILAEDSAGTNRFTGSAFESNKLWTGVWGHNGGGSVTAGPIWLVSGETPNPFQTLGADSVRVFPEINSDSEIRVPTETLRNSTGNRIGQIGYWISDEGVKASFAARRQHILDHEGSASAFDREEIEYQADFGVNLDVLFNNPAVDLEDTSSAQDLLKAGGIRDLDFVQDSAGNTYQPLETTFASHDMTPAALAVLENPLDGGLRKNISDPSYTDSFFVDDQVQKFLGPKSGPLLVEDRLPSDLGINPGDPYFSPRPILTEAVLYVGLFHTFSDAKLRIRYHVEAEFLNPYSYPLIFRRDGDSRWDRGVVLVFENLPTITVRDRSGIAPTITENLNNFSAYSASDTRKYINSWVEISPDSVSQTPELLSGEVYQVREPNPSTQARGLARDFGTTRWSGNQGTRPANTAQIEIRAQHPNRPLTLKVVPYSRLRSGPFPNNPIDRQPIQEITLDRTRLPFTNFRINKTFNSGPNPFSRPTSSSYVIDDYVFAYHFRILSDETDPTSVRDLLSSVHFLDPAVDSASSFTTPDGTTKTLDTVIDPISLDPPAVVQDTLNLFSDLDLLRDLNPRSHANTFREKVLIDVPNGNALSMGQLSSLPIYQEPPRIIGSERGGIYNEVFDRYYLSPKEEFPTGSFRILSPALAAWDNPEDTSDDVIQAAEQDDAQHEMILGAFNINSTSTLAWEALLSSPVLTPPAYNLSAPVQSPATEGPGDVSRAGTFFRNPVHASTQVDFVARDASQPTDTARMSYLRDPEWAFSQGIRSFDDAEGRGFLRFLAGEIVERLLERGEPFPTLSSFVNSGILQASIDAYRDTGGAGVNDGLFEYSNVYFLQNDIVTKLAPVATTRSDTFKIRAYGNYIHPETGEQISEARCEVWVQRLPAKLDNSNSRSPADSLLNMRRFEIVDFKWVENEDS